MITTSFFYPGGTKRGGQIGGKARGGVESGRGSLGLEGGACLLTSGKIENQMSGCRR